MTEAVLDQVVRNRARPEQKLSRLCLEPRALERSFAEAGGDGSDSHLDVEPG